MLLAVDIGNTQTAVGIYDGKELRASWRIESDSKATSDQLLVQINSLIKLKGHGELFVTEAIVSSVVPMLTLSWVEALEFLIGEGGSVDIVNAAEDYGIPVKYENRREIGPDRICDAVAAVAKYGAPVIVIDLGTATNIEAIDDEGAFLGGIIAPGLRVSAEALFSHAARLSSIDIKVPEHAIGRSTTEAVQSGLTFGEVDRIDGLVDRIKAEMGCDATVVATGGYHQLMLPISRTIDYADGLLTLDGLRIIHERKHAKNH
ncbi:MAG: type III pantothenate kinase [Coriobacteriales bacterium]|nr:type III pantothenate kinase [Coriobacteriales bacterium]